MSRSHLVLAGNGVVAPLVAHGMRTSRHLLAVTLALCLTAVSCSSTGTEQQPGSANKDDLSPIEYDIQRDPDVPTLPFDDNPDPTQCGIPIAWGRSDNRAWLTGEWEGEMVQSEVLLYDSHLRVSVTGSAPHGTKVEIVLFQENPVLDYYFVRVAGDQSQEGWVPEPFLSFDPAG